MLLRQSIVARQPSAPAFRSSEGNVVVAGWQGCRTWFDVSAICPKVRPTRTSKVFFKAVGGLVTSSLGIGQRDSIHGCFLAALEQNALHKDIAGILGR